ncbi:VOC family protein [Bacteroidota bacterium]
MKKLISWVEIPAVDIQRATGFYNKILKIEMDILDWEKEKMACFPSGEGAISFAPGFKPSKDGVLVSLNTEDDLDGTIARIEANGGEIVQQKTKIEAEGRGYFAIFIDCEGNKVGLYGN